MPNWITVLWPETNIVNQIYANKNFFFKKRIPGLALPAILIYMKKWQLPLVRNLNLHSCKWRKAVGYSGDDSEGKESARNAGDPGLIPQ